MTKSLSPRDAAQRLGITVETLRRWEKDGLIQSERTPGGQRRFREDAVVALLDEPSPRKLRRGMPKRVARIAFADDELEGQSSGPDVPGWEQRVNEERADLEVSKLRRERARLAREEQEEEEAREFRKEEARRIAEEREAKERQDAVSASMEKARLESLRSYGRTIAIMAPSEYQAKVARELVNFVTSRSLPSDLDVQSAREHVRIRVEETLSPWRESEESEHRKAETERKRQSLVSSGKWYAYSQTASWTFDDGRAARADVDQALADEVESDWTESDVRQLVDEVLDEWDTQE